MQPNKLSNILSISACSKRMELLMYRTETIVLSIPWSKILNAFLIFVQMITVAAIVYMIFMGNANAAETQSFCPKDRSFQDIAIGISLIISAIAVFALAMGRMIQMIDPDAKKDSK